MVSAIIPPPASAAPAVDVTIGIAAAGSAPADLAPPAIADVANPASVVQLSAQAQILSTAATVAAQPDVALPGVAVPVANPAMPITDPAVAAAIAAYRVSEGIFSENEPVTEEVPPENELDVTATRRLQGTVVDLHDSVRDDALHGSVWTWRRVNPVHRNFTKR